MAGGDRAVFDGIYGINGMDEIGSLKRMHLVKWANRISFTLLAVGLLIIILSFGAVIFWPYDSGLPSVYPLSNDDPVRLEAQLRYLTAQAYRHAAVEWNLWLTGLTITGSGFVIRIWIRAKARKMGI